MKRVYIIVMPLLLILGLFRVIPLKSASATVCGLSYDGQTRFSLIMGESGAYNQAAAGDEIGPLVDCVATTAKVKLYLL